MIAILAICCGDTSYEAMKDWAVNYQDRLKKELPFLAGHMPAKSTFHRVFSSLDAEEIEKILGKWLQMLTHLEKYEGIAIDGKTNKNTDLHYVSAFAHQAKAVLFQKSTTSKGKELVVGPEVLDQIDLTNKLVTVDALFAQRKFCKKIVEGGGGYVIPVKDNQRNLKAGIKVYFEDQSACDVKKLKTLDAHKGRVEERTYQVTDNTELLEYLNWPGLTHVWKCVRKTTTKRTGKVSVQVVHGIANFLELSPIKDQTTVIRGHWSIENNLHWNRDVNFKEDKSTIRTKSGPQVMSALTNLVISIFHRGNVKSFPAANRRFKAQTQELFAFLGLYRQQQLAFQAI